MEMLPPGGLTRGFLSVGCKNQPLNVLLFLLCLAAGPSDGAVQELAYGRHRDEWGKQDNQCTNLKAPK